MLEDAFNKNDVKKEGKTVQIASEVSNIESFNRPSNLSNETPVK